jgi:hypothetical protein
VPGTDALVLLAVLNTLVAERRQRTNLRRTSCFRLRRGGAHTSFGRGTKISITYGPQTNLVIDRDP